MIEANISADAAPAARAMTRIAIISCPAPFERLEVFQKPQPSATGRPGSLMKNLVRGAYAADQGICLANDVRQQTEETRALDGAREFTLLLGGYGGDAARHDAAARRDVTAHKIHIPVL